MPINPPLPVQAIASSVPKPFLKWAGGKSQLLEPMTPFFPQEFFRYGEPFTGSAAVYWRLFALRETGALHFTGARLTDSNAELVNGYIIVRDEVAALIELLTQHRSRHDKAYYYQVRALRAEGLSPLERAARLIYLNKTCFNGLYRVNRAGRFNVPMGRYENPRIFDTDDLLNASRALQGVDLAVADFREVLNWARAGDFLYFDPPYAPVSKTANFTSYTTSTFGDAEQQELAAVLHELDRRGCKVMLSNSWVDSILELYKDFRCIELKATRAINSNPDKRGKVSELLAINYETTNHHESKVKDSW